MNQSLIAQGGLAHAVSVLRCIRVMVPEDPILGDLFSLVVILLQNCHHEASRGVYYEGVLLLRRLDSLSFFHKVQ